MRQIVRTALIAALLSSPAIAQSEKDALVFEAYPESTIFQGRPHAPDFRARDREYSMFRTRLLAGVRAGPNFAGRYSIVEIGCGSSCRNAYVIDLGTGRVTHFPLGGEDNPSLTLKFKRSSRALVSYWVDEDSCMREVFSWDGRSFEGLGSSKVGDAEYCWQRLG